MKPYLSLFAMSRRRILAYKLNSAIGWAGGAAWLICSLAVWHELLLSGSIGGYDWPTMKAYLLIAWACNALGLAYGDWQMSERIREGDVAIDLTKPMDFQLARFSEMLGGLVIELIAIGIALLGVMLFADGLPWPKSGWFLLSVVLVIPTKFLISYLTSMVCFWTHNFMGVSWAKEATVLVFSGGLIPLALLPGPMGGLAAVLPFAGMVATPAALYLGQTDPLLPLAQQVMWILILLFISRLVWRKALRALTIHGG